RRSGLSFGPRSGEGMTARKKVSETAPALSPEHARIASLLAKCRPNHSLPQPFYRDRAIHDFDLAAIFNRHWLQACLEIEIPEPGDFITLTIGASPIVVLRDESGRIRGFFNTCRHRG